MTSQTGPQVRAAQAWADLPDDELATKIGVSKRTLSRLKGGAYLSRERCSAVAEATGVPEWFIVSGFEGATGPDQPALVERLEALEHRVDSLYELALNRVAGDLGRDRREPGEGSGAGGKGGRPD